MASGNHKEIPSYLRVLHVHQEQEGSNLTVLQTVLAADKERELLLKEQKRLSTEMSKDDLSEDLSIKNNSINTLQIQFQPHYYHTCRFKTSKS